MHRPRIFFVAGWRYEPAWLVRELKQNLSWADKVVIVDDRSRTDQLWVNEGRYRLMQRKALEEAGIRPWDWVAVTSPDERWSTGAEQVFRQLIKRRQRVVYEFPLREMWSLTHYRTDGMWGGKWRPRLFPYLPGQKFTQRKIQTKPTPVGAGYRKIRIPNVPLYHLENIAPSSRAERAIVYEALSPGSQERAAASKFWMRYDPAGEYMRRYGYAYLADPRGMRLSPVPPRDIKPAVTRPYIFRVPDDLLYAESGKTRDQWNAWLLRTLASTPRVPRTR